MDDELCGVCGKSVARYDDDDGCKGHPCEDCEYVNELGACQQECQDMPRNPKEMN